MDYRVTIIIGIIRKYAIPTMLGGLVLWLIANGYNDWVPVVCGAADNLGFVVGECK
jgi:hypothetical protein